MYDFYIMIENYMKLRVDEIKWEVKTTVITNWGTYTKDDFLIKDVSNPNHEKHNDFLTEINRIKQLPNLVHNFHHLYTVKRELI
jgi:hypothetical protein